MTNFRIAKALGTDKGKSGGGRSRENRDYNSDREG